jgi:tetratricopeptide (TPR) repeat protein
MRNNIHKPSTINRWHYILAGIISAILMVWSALWGYAEILVITPRHNITHWETTGGVIDQHAAKEARGRLQKATMLNSSNAEFYMDLARLATLQANSLQVSRQDQKQHQNQAMENLKITIKKRPTWGLAWAKLAQIYADAPQNRELFIQALERAIYFEPYEILNQQQVIPLGISHWVTLPESLKVDFRKMVTQTLRYHPKLAPSIIKTAVAYDWAEELTSLIENKKQIMQLEKEIMNKNQPS